MDRSDVCPIVKVKPWGKGQGDFVEVSLEDFDPAIHKAIGGVPEPVAEAPADPMPANPDDLVVPPPEQVANEVVEAPAPVAAKPAPKRRKKRAAKK